MARPYEDSGKMFRRHATRVPFLTMKRESGQGPAADACGSESALRTYPPHYPISSPLPSLLFPLPFLRSLVVTPSSLPLHSSFIIFFAFPITPPPTVETVGYPQPSLRDCPSSPQAAPPPPPRVP